MRNTQIFNSRFSFRKTNSDEVSKIIDNLNTKKACQNSDIPAKITKPNKDIIASLISENFNSCIDNGEFGNGLKHADIVPVHKKEFKQTRQTLAQLT